MSKKLFIVTTGSYSDYRLFGVYDTVEKAEAVKKALGFDANDVYPATLNDGYAELQKEYRTYRVEMGHDGTTLDIGEGTFEEGVTWKLLRLIKRYDREAQHTNEVYLQWRGFAKDKKHAVKIVNEIRARLIAQNEWHTGDKNYRDVA